MSYIQSEGRIRLATRDGSILGRLMLFGAVVLGSCAPTAAPTLSTGRNEPASIAPVAATAQSPAADPSRSAEPSSSSEASSPDDCSSVIEGLGHQDPDLEALLPARVGGRSLVRWSLRGRCWLEATAGKENVDALIAGIEQQQGGGHVDLTELRYAIAGRADTKRDPPFFVFVAGRPQDDPEVSLALYLLLGGAAFHDVAEASDMSRYQMRAIGGKRVAVGTEAMLDQNEHQRGRPFLYQTDDYMFVIITDDDAWAADALSQLP